MTSNGQQRYGVLRSSHRGHFAGYYPLTSDAQCWNLINNHERVHGCVHGCVQRCVHKRGNFVLQRTDLTDRFHMGTYLGRLQYGAQRTLFRIRWTIVRAQPLTFNERQPAFALVTRAQMPTHPDVTVAICGGSVASKIGYCAPSAGEGLSG